jgi:hypothetical protein
MRAGIDSTMWRFVALWLSLALGVLVLAGVASGHKQGYDTNLQLRVDRLTATTTQYSGSVRSERAKCERNRVITITTGGVAIGTATSDFEGNYTVVVTGTPPARNQDVTASTPRRWLKRNSEHKHKCRPATVTRNATGQPV